MTPRRGHSVALEVPAALGTGIAVGPPAVRGRAPTRRWPSLAAWVRLARPADNIFAALGTLIGAGLAGVASPARVVLVVALSNALLSAASMVFNDWHDVAEDAVNRPDRPIPSGAVRRPSALIASILLFGAGIVAATVGGSAFGLAAAGIATASIVYTWRLKSVPLVGNGTVGLLSAYPLWCWMLVTRVDGLVYVGAAAAFFVGGTGREVVRTAADAAGDAALGIRTVATRYGGTRAVHAGLGLILAGLLCAWLSSAAAGFGYFTALALTTAAMLVTGIASVGSASAPHASRRITRVARAMTAVLAGGAVWDLMASGWLRP